ncbi:MAG TPA: hypothetical protein DET46_01850 [Comamonadaceae bacterium]|jgi:hypothetical protein|uniref:hypothetical protein n=1 Tax=unclassified Acidovorax TaxID=2684926 RepID=UPI0008C737A4|nr:MULTISPECIES: hypothetical protein [unclassified Acidovorax]MCL4768805.1 hypothetical protein [Burkholderiaceae bacterium]OGB45647.1 MAG: hypothetical protein A3F76_10235 [Burkholderiales bacterium RIFCSPLOWO2_12_FULL_65_40]HCE27700.1 hypothetical protein [Comamonadaceae bacterium]MBL7090499.1 hypothetical protein [Acidovorax sp.]NCU66858.1 hypothetical protein [Acidovorax sp. 210-6]
MHAQRKLLKRLIANVGAALRHVRAIAEQFRGSDPWAALVRYVSERIAPGSGPQPPPTALAGDG